jgi:hypothetical protein
VRAGRALVRVGIGGPDIPPTSYLVEDTFTRANSASSLGVADSGQTWTAHAGTWGITSDKGYLATQSGDSVATVDAGAADIDMSCTITMQGAPGLVFRATDNNNYLLFMYNGGEMQVWQRVAGSYTKLSGVTQGVTPGVAYVYRVVTLGTSITTYLDGVLKNSVTSSQFQTATRIGLRMNDSGAARWDDLTVS